MKRFRWGIFGSGAISAKFAAGINPCRGELTLVASRGEQGRALANAFSVQNFVEGYEAAAAAAPNLVDAIYIATPPAYHREHALLCIQAKVPVLIEKPFASDADSARAIVGAARANGVFCMEAMWTRFLPALQKFRTVVQDGTIGEPHLISGSFGSTSVVDASNGNFDPSRGGGALAHLGYYPLSLGQWLFGSTIEVKAMGTVGSTGVDEDVAISLRYENGVIGSFHTSLRAPCGNGLAVHGTHGMVELVGPIYCPWGIRVTATKPARRSSPDLSRKALFKQGHLYNQIVQLRERIRRPGAFDAVPFSGNGYSHEAEEVAQRVAAGDLESPIMPLDSSVALTALIDSLKQQVLQG